LVAAAFIGPRPIGMHINHIDGVKSNNFATNLEYVTPSENTKHSYRLGLQSQAGIRHTQAKLNDEKVREIRNRVAAGESQSKIASSFNVSQATVCLVALRKRWAHVKDANKIMVLQ
jgi:FixJ family two-component response regulator